MNPQEFHISYNRALHVFILCLGALIGPFFIASGLEPKYKKNLILGLILFGYCIFWLIKTFPHRNVIPKTDKIAFLVMPAILIPVGVLLAYFGNEI